jgi:hypothetical protein
LAAPLHELTDKTSTLEDLSIAATKQLEKLHDLSSTSHQFATLHDVVAPLATKPRQPDAQIAFAVRTFELSYGSVSISNVARQVGLSFPPV